MKNKFNVVSGLRRGGTSVMMLALRQSGIPIIGFKYPFQFDFDYVNLKTRKVDKAKVKQDGGLLEPLEDVKKHNPKGFWEVSSITLKEGLQEKHAGIGENGDLIKVTSDVLPTSNPKMIDKTIVMIREPRKVIASMLNAVPVENEKEWSRFAALGLLHNMVSCLKWLNYHKKKYRVVRYEDLLENPAIIIKDICKFLKRGDYRFGVEVVEKKLDKEKPIEYNNNEIQEVEEFYFGNHNKGRKYNEYDIKKIQTKMEVLSAKHNIKLDKV